MKFYKYTSLASAIKIIKSGSVILNNPNNFNDPFDTNIIIDEQNKQETLNLMYNYYLLKEIRNLVNNKSLKLNVSQKALFSIIKTEFKAFDKLSKKQNEYQELPFLNDCIDLIKDLNPSFSTFLDSIDKQFDEIINGIITTEKEKLRITCFSKRNDSILMWSHYGDSHRGVCFEFEDDRDIFKDVIYQDERPYFDFKTIVARILMADYKNVECKLDEDKYKDIFLNPFFIKQNDWNYEHELRCVLSDNEKNIDGFINDGGTCLLEMKISKIYIGLKSDGPLLNDLLMRAYNRGIPVVFMKEDSQKFKIVPDVNKKSNFAYDKIENIRGLDLLESEINKCLDNECFIAAFILASIIPSVLGKHDYPNINEKEAFIKWFDENIGDFERDEEDDFPYVSGELLFNLKEHLINNWNTKIEENYGAFNLSDFKLVIQDKDKYEIYTSSFGLGTNKEGGSMELSVRDICNKLLHFLKKYNEASPNEDFNSKISLKYLDKEIDEMKELGYLNETLNRIGEK